MKIPSQVTQLYEFVFEGCTKLESIYLPEALIEIQDNAFDECINLKTVYYAGSKADWDKIIIGENNAYLLNAEIVFDYAD